MVVSEVVGWNVQWNQSGFLPHGRLDKANGFVDGITSEMGIYHNLSEKKAPIEDAWPLLMEQNFASELIPCCCRNYNQSRLRRSTPAMPRIPEPNSMMLPGSGVGGPQSPSAQ
jgi:hypothetical protein